MSGLATVRMAANQSVHRSGSTRISDISIPPQGGSTTEFQYEELDPSVDCMRLIELDPGGDADDVPRCKLIHVTFGQKPRYQALSYMWGDVTIKKKISVEGKELLVGQNLWDALRYLRNCGSSRHYWIDAICINQANIFERNRQLRIMPHIYMRAQTVLVWLGRKYAKYRAEDWQVWMDWRVDGKSDMSFSASELVARMEQKQLISTMSLELCSDDYWNRVWIVQEIGMARTIQVCFKECRMTWNTFIHRLTLSCGGNGNGPFILERMLRNKHHRGHTLRELLENHQQAVCKDPRDKIYGFVGLAADARMFPMDYRKPLLEVWKDTMTVMYGHAPFGHDMVLCASLVKNLLGGRHVASKEQVAREYASRTEPPLRIDNKDPRYPTFDLTAYVAGMIICIGPSTAHMMGDLDAVDEWRAQIQQNFPDESVDADHDNDLLVEVLLNAENDDPDLLSLSRLHVCWSAPKVLCEKIQNCRMRSKLEVRSGNFKDEGPRASPMASDIEPQGPKITEALVPASTPRLYQMKRIIPQSSPWKMGIVAGEAQVGDLICWIPRVKKAVAVRINDGWLEIIGTAMAPTKLFWKGTQNRTNYFESDEELELHLDLDSAYVLLT
ncbi:hypothetical protein PV08_01427 [Exophiala spinifera]|uniref:Heterokaryon incompatibility domain-containing protein n=1 Tax=Exophiala spinifera TaxID=91928 RepID=A0A0D2CBC5_9EURO|nr:uncharacterized protein PV08_01427 [Exophiala spinifera]KIW20849.1 hypothetical protein PV08_01427 [Exophiala spinifera]